MAIAQQRVPTGIRVDEVASWLALHVPGSEAPLHEHRILSALARSGVPVPEPLALGEDEAVNEAPFTTLGGA